jgi:hypothetical protein
MPRLHFTLRDLARITLYALRSAEPRGESRGVN